MVIAVVILLAPSALAGGEVLDYDDLVISLKDIPYHKVIYGNWDVKIDGMNENIIALILIVPTRSTTEYNVRLVSGGEQSLLEISGSIPGAVAVTLVKPSLGGDYIQIETDNVEINVYAFSYTEIVDMARYLSDAVKENFVIMGNLRNVGPVDSGGYYDRSLAVRFGPSPHKTYLVEDIESVYGTVNIYRMNGGTVWEKVNINTDTVMDGILILSGDDNVRYMVKIRDPEDGSSSVEYPVVAEQHNRTVMAGENVFFSADGSYPVSDIIGVEWYFGDGNVSGEWDTYHTYMKPGVYNASLTVWDSEGRSNSTSFVVNVLPNPPPDFDYSVNGSVVSFQAHNVSGNVTWYFGDGSTGYGINTAHIYRYPGKYPVTMLWRGISVRKDIVVREFRDEIKYDPISLLENESLPFGIGMNITGEYGGMVFIYSGNNSTYVPITVKDITPTLNFSVYRNVTFLVDYVGRNNLTTILYRDSTEFLRGHNSFSCRVNLPLSSEYRVMFILNNTSTYEFVHLSILSAGAARVDVFLNMSGIYSSQLSLNALLSIMPVTFFATGYDPADRVFIRLNIDGKYVCAANDYRSVSLYKEISLSDGVHRIFAELYDDSGNRVVKFKNITVTETLNDLSGGNITGDGWYVERAGNYTYFRGFANEILLYAPLAYYLVPDENVFALVSREVSEFDSLASVDVAYLVNDEGKTCRFYSSHPVRWYFSDNISFEDRDYVERTFWHAAEYSCVVVGEDGNFTVLEFSVSDSPPRVYCQIPENLTEGEIYEFHAEIEEVGYAESYWYVDGKYVSYSSLKMAFAAGEHRIKVIVVDDEGNTMARNFTVNVSNVPPVVRTHSWYTTERTSVRFYALIYDFGNMNITWYVDSVAVSHEQNPLVYLAPGIYNVTLSVSDSFVTVNRTFVLRILRHSLGGDVRVNSEEEDWQIMPDIAADSRGTLYAVWADNHTESGKYAIYMARSCNLGRTWGERILIYEDDSSINILPRIAVWSSGNKTYIHLIWTRVYIRNHRIDADVYYMKSEDGGSSWSEPLPIAKSHKIEIGRDIDAHGRYIAVLYTRIGGLHSKLYILRSSDYGETFWKKKVACGPGYMDGRVRIFAGSEGLRIHLIYYRPLLYLNFNRCGHHIKIHFRMVVGFTQIYYRSFAFNSSHLGRRYPVVTVDNLGVKDASLDVDFRGYPHVAYSVLNVSWFIGDDPNYDIYHAYSSDGGRNWSTDAVATSEYAEYRCSINTDENGRVHIVYLLETSSEWNIIYRGSEDNFTSTMVLNSVNTSVRTQPTSVYERITKNVVAVWMDERGGTWDIYSFSLKVGKRSYPYLEPSYIFTGWKTDRRGYILNTSFMEFYEDLVPGKYFVVVNSSGEIEGNGIIPVYHNSTTFKFFVCVSRENQSFALRAAHGFSSVYTIKIYREEIEFGNITPYILPDPDTDGDGLCDDFEKAMGLKTESPDSDGDSTVTYGSLAKTIPIGMDGAEVLAGTSPHIKDSDGDNLKDTDELRGWAVSIPLVLNTSANPMRYEGKFRIDNFSVCVFSSSLKYDSFRVVSEEEKVFDVGNEELRLYPSTYSVYLVPSKMPVKNVPVKSSVPVPPWMIEYREEKLRMINITVQFFSLNPLCYDTDADGIYDYREIKEGSSPISEDFDCDSLSDAVELNYEYQGKRLNPLCNDTDMDGLNDSVETERFFYTLPVIADSDGDGINDGEEFRYWISRGLGEIDASMNCVNPDVDSDTMPDGWEIKYGLDPMVDDAYGDYDYDGLSNVGEWNFGSSPVREDTDGDGLLDGEEVVGITMRTNVRNGAVSAMYYNDLDSTNWLWFSLLEIRDGYIGQRENKSFRFSHYEYLNSTIPDDKVSLYLLDGRSQVYGCWADDGRTLLVYVGPVKTVTENNTTRYLYAVFQQNNSLSVVWRIRSAKGFKDMEIPWGSLPSRLDSDSDGVYDREFLVHSPPMVVKIYHDRVPHPRTQYGYRMRDLALDKYEVYVLFRLDPTWQSLAIELRNWSDVISRNLPPKLIKFSYTGNMYSSLPSGCRGIGIDYWNRPIYIKGDYLYYDLGAYAPEDKRYVEYVRNSSAGVSTSPFPQENLVALGYEVHYIPDTDGDGSLDIEDEDSDNDGIIDGTEPLYWYDLDGDSLTGMRDVDSDADGIADGVEDSNHNGSLDSGETSPVRADTDGDGLLDGSSIPVDSAPAYFSSLNLVKVVMDGEVRYLGESDTGTSPSEYDTDGDMLSDAEEFIGWDGGRLLVDDRGRYCIAVPQNSISTNYYLDNKTFSVSLPFNAEVGVGDLVVSGELDTRDTDGSVEILYVLHIVTPNGEERKEISLGTVSGFAAAIAVMFIALSLSQVPPVVSIRPNRTSALITLNVMDRTASFEVEGDYRGTPFMKALAPNVFVYKAMVGKLNTLHSFTSPLNGDYDSDGLVDGEEFLWSALPTMENTDSDDLSDYDEVEFGSYPYTEDSDGDGLSDSEEYYLETDPLSPDTDSDGLDDFNETEVYPTDPLNADSDSDMLPDGLEIHEGYIYVTGEDAMYSADVYFDRSGWYVLYFRLDFEIDAPTEVKIDDSSKDAHAHGNWVYCRAYIEEGIHNIRLNDAQFHTLIGIPVSLSLPGNFEWIDSEGALKYETEFTVSKDAPKSLDVFGVIPDNYELVNASAIVVPSYVLYRSVDISQPSQDPDHTVSIASFSIGYSTESYASLVLGLYNLTLRWPEGYGDLSGVDIDVWASGILRNIHLDDSDFTIKDSWTEYNGLYYCRAYKVNNAVEIDFDGFYRGPVTVKITVTSNKDMTGITLKSDVILRKRVPSNFNISCGGDYEVIQGEFDSLVKLPLYGVFHNSLVNKEGIKAEVEVGTASVHIIAYFRPRVSDPLCNDSDMDGVNDSLEYYYNASTLRNDTDNDYLSDFGEFSVLDHFSRDGGENLDNHMQRVLEYREAAIWIGTVSDDERLYIATRNENLASEKYMVSVVYRRCGEDTIISFVGDGWQESFNLNNPSGVFVFFITPANNMYPEDSYYYVRITQGYASIHTVSITKVLDEAEPENLGTDYYAQLNEESFQIGGGYTITKYWYEGHGSIQLSPSTYFNEIGEGYYTLVLHISVTANTDIVLSTSVEAEQRGMRIGAASVIDEGTVILFLYSISSLITISFHTRSRVMWGEPPSPDSIPVTVKIISMKLLGQWVGTNVIDDDTDNDGAVDGGDFNPLIADSDGDGLLDGTELRIGTDPFCWDTDRDGLSDGDEVLETGTDPLDADTDDDGLTDGYVVPYHSPSEDVDFHTVEDGEVMVKKVKLAEFGWSTVYKFTHEINITYKGERANTISYEGYYALGEMSVGCTDPTVADSDNDGAPDGLEAYIAEYLGNTTDFAVADSDSDGIPDYVEIRAYLWAAENSNNAPEDTSLWLNPLIDDAYNDSDSDGLANIEEWERSSYKFDYDNDEIPNFYDVDDDDDELPTSVELSVDLNPFNSADAHGDKDHDGLDNLWEYENGTMINDNDTDHDGIDDGAEFAYWQDYLYKLWDGWVNEETGAEVNETVVDYLKDPDVDRDNVTDGKEINGWTVKIIVGYDEENNPISKDVTLYGDPLAAYRAPRKEDGELGDYIDSDEDNIPDIVESLLSNNSTFAKFARLFADPTSEYYDLWTSYNWTIAYFFSVRNNRNFHYYLDLLDANKYSAEQIARYITEWNNTAPHNKSCAENATKWLQDQFNPLITESMAPVITEYHVMTVYRGEVFPGVPNAKAQIVLEIRDVAGISHVRIRSICPDIAGIMIWTIDMDFNGETSVIIGKDEPFYIDVTEYSAVLTYNISVNATDTLGNSAEWYKEIDGPFGAFIKTVANMLRAFWDFLCEIGAKIAEGLNIIVEWFKNMFMKMIDPLVQPIANSISDWLSDWANIIINILYKIGLSNDMNHRVKQNADNTDISALARIIINMIFSISFATLLLIGTALIIMEYTAKAFPVLYAVIALLIISIITVIAISLNIDIPVINNTPPTGYIEPSQQIHRAFKKIPPNVWWSAQAPLLYTGLILSIYIHQSALPSTVALAFADIVISLIALGLIKIIGLGISYEVGRWGKLFSALIAITFAADSCQKTIFDPYKEYHPFTTALIFVVSCITMFISSINFMYVLYHYFGVNEGDDP